MRGGLGDWARWRFGVDARSLARHWQRETAASRDREGRRDLSIFLETFGGDSDSEAIRLARASDLAGRWGWVRVPLSMFLGQHSWVSGATGSGKSFYLLAILCQVLARGDVPVVIVDLKGELSSLLRELVIPALVGTPAGDALIEHLRVIRPFDRQHLPMLRLTQREENVAPEIQAYNIASSIEDALGETLGGRMLRSNLQLTKLDIELGLPLTEVLAWLEDPERLRRDAMRSDDSSIRRYVLETLQRENRSSLEALKARLDTFFFLPETRLCLAAPECVSFADCLNSGVTIVDVGDPPAGAERVARFWAGALTGRLTRAILSREVTERTPHCWVIWEEFQEALGRNQTEQFGRLLALARFKRVGLTFVNQQPGQIAARDPALVRLLRTNTGIEAVFRCNYEDARSFAHALPVPRDAKSVAAARQQLTEEMTQLPDRTHYLWLKRMPFRAQEVRSPRVDLDQLRRKAGQASRDVRERIRRGTVSRSREELETIVRESAREDPPRDLWIPMRSETESNGEFPSLG